jgi:6-phosphogluconolactonase/glucosamine-6-phosphate isomerase/deaminase
MQFISSKEGKEGVEKMAGEISDALLHGKKVLWLICGGSNIPLAKTTMDVIRARAGGHIQNLCIGQTDERYGPVGHPDSNWQQMIDAGFAFEGAWKLPILLGKPLKETVAEYATKLEEAFFVYDHVVAQFGIGADGHVAGMLPHTGGMAAKELVYGYEAGTFVRVTITPPAFKHIESAYAFAFGVSKHEAVTKLWQKDLTIDEMPCQILKRIPKSYFYSDQL